MCLFEQKFLFYIYVAAGQLRLHPIWFQPKNEGFKTTISYIRLEFLYLFYKIASTEIYNFRRFVGVLKIGDKFAITETGVT